MRRGFRLSAVILPSLLVITAAIPSWAWRGGFRGPGIGLYVAGGPWWGYDYPYYGPPDYPYYYPDAAQPYPYTYALPVAPSQETQTAAPDNSRQDLKFLYRQIAQARNQVDFDYQDGDISRSEHNAELMRLYRIKKEAQTEAKLNGGYLTGDQENELLQLLRSGGEVSESYAPRAPEASNKSVKKVNDEITGLRSLLDAKLTQGNITRAQHDSLMDYLKSTEQHVQSDAAQNDGSLTPDEESAVLLQLQRVSDSLTKNLVVN